MADTIPSGDVLTDTTATWEAHEVAKVDKEDSPLQVPAPVPADAKTRLTAKAANTAWEAWRKFVRWLNGADVAGQANTPIRLADGIALADGPTVRAGTGSPEGVIEAPVGSTWHRTDGAAGSTHYYKETGTGDTGWAAAGAAKRTHYWEAHNSWTSLNDAFFDFVDTTESTNVDDLGNQRIAPFAGSVTKIWLRRELGAAVEDVGVEVRSVTDTDPLTSALEEYQEVTNPPSDNEVFVLPDYVSNSFAQGAMLAFKLIKTGGTFQNDVRVLIEYTES